MSTHSGIRGGRKPGTSGQHVTVTTNSFPVLTVPQAVFYHYDVFEKPLNRQRSLEIIERLQLQNASLFNPRAAYDGKKNMFRSKPIDLPGGSATFKVFTGGYPEQSANINAKGFMVKITPVARIDTSSILPVLKGERAHSSESLMTITILNVLIRMQPIMTHPSNARAFFTKDVRDMQLGTAFELWRGFFQSVRPSMDRLTVNVDIATAVMYQGGPLIEVVLAFLGVRDARSLMPTKINPLQHRKLESFLKNLLVYSTIPKPTPGKRQRVRPIRNVVLVGANNYRFGKDGEGPDDYEEQTISEYFLSAHRYKVGLGEAICIGFSRDIVYPLEVLQVQEGQIYKKTLPPSLAARALKFATQRPDQRLKAIERSGSLLGYGDSDYLRHSGMTIDTRPLSIPGRVLAPPAIQFGGNQRPTVPVDGAWNLVGKRLFLPSKVSCWAVINFDPRLDPRAIADFVKRQVDACEQLGMQFAKTKPPIFAGRPQGKYEDFRRQLEDVGLDAIRAFNPETGAERPKFLLVILPESASDIRAAVKHWGDCVRGCPTQCMKTGKVISANNQYHNNLALKINAKIGGVNSVPSENSEAIKWLKSVPTMIVGADVSHGPPDSTRPSITGLVSSVDEYASRYVAFTGMQGSRVEIIQDIETMIKDAVSKFNDYQKNMHQRDIYPQRVIFYRDGVSEGQFGAVAENEVAKVKKTLDYETRKSGAPCKLTFIVVGKNHHVRFFPRQGEGDRSGNCPAGLVVDQGIVNPVSYDFYLQSHGGLLGTSRSSHYSVLEDENKLGADPLQELSYTLCHVYARATRSVSIPAPVYYADIVCARGAFHSTILDDGDESTVSGQQETLEVHRQMFRPVADSMAQTMYFM